MVPKPQIPAASGNLLDMEIFFDSVSSQAY